MAQRFLDEPAEEAPNFGFILIAVALTLVAIASGVYFGYYAGESMYKKKTPEKSALFQQHQENLMASSLSHFLDA